VKAEPFIRRLFGPFEHQIGEKYRSIFIDMDVFKDWERNSSPIHWLCDAWDRWLTGDRVSYMTFLEMRERLIHGFGKGALDEARIGPWANNVAALVRS
jgi:hypothetical protein